MQRRSRIENRAGLPQQLLQSPPRSITLSKAGIVTLMAMVAIAGLGAFGATQLYARARASDRVVSLLASEAIQTSADVVRVQRRGSGDDRRSVVHYRYLANDREELGTTTVRKRERDKYIAGSPVIVRYLASEPRRSWMVGYEPGREPFWPAFAVSAGCALAILAIGAQTKRQADLLKFGRPAQALITQVQKKQGQHGAFWRVQYEWRLLSGGKRSGSYNHAHKHPPVVGGSLAVLYDRDRPRRHARYPLGLVKLRAG